MVNISTLEKYLDTLLKGNRKQCRTIIEQSLQSGIPANSVYAEIIWPIMVEIEYLLHTDKITPAQEHLATRINRTIVDQLQNKLPHKSDNNKKVVIACAESELQELGAQMTADLFESDGWEVKFIGGGLSNDEVLTFINEYGPDILLVYGTSAKQAPEIRKLIDTIKDVNAWPNMKIMVSGGLFNRAEGLWIEMGADLFAENAQQALQAANSNGNSVKPEEQRTINKRKRRKKKTAQQQSKNTNHTKSEA